MCRQAVVGAIAQREVRAVADAGRMRRRRGMPVTNFLLLRGTRMSRQVSQKMVTHLKAGAYAIQGLAATFVSYLEGSYSGVMGLPLFETAALLKKLGINGLA